MSAMSRAVLGEGAASLKKTRVNVGGQRHQEPMPDQPPSKDLVAAQGGELSEGPS